MSVSIKQQFKHHPVQEQTDLNRVAKAIQTDLDGLRASIVGITAQLDADAGVTDTDYAANNDPAANSLVD